MYFASLKLTQSSVWGGVATEHRSATVLPPHLPRGRLGAVLYRSGGGVNALSEWPDSYENCSPPRVRLDRGTCVETVSGGISMFALRIAASRNEKAKSAEAY